jgi:hypothetical protein
MAAKKRKRHKKIRENGLTFTLFFVYFVSFRGHELSPDFKVDEALFFSRSGCAGSLIRLLNWLGCKNRKEDVSRWRGDGDRSAAGEEWSYLRAAIFGKPCPQRFCNRFLRLISSFRIF